MRRILLTLLAAVGLMTVNAQNLNKIKDALAANKYAEAKTMVETFLASPKNQKNPELLYLKGKVLSAIAANPKERAAMPEARLQALDAFKKSLEADKNQATLFLTVDNYQPVFSLYASGFEEGAGYYNEEKYEDALGIFKTTGIIGDYIFGQGWGLYQLDTTLIYYTGLAAINVKNEDEAFGYFTRLADANVGGTSDMSTPYRYLAKYYYDKIPKLNISIGQSKESVIKELGNPNSISKDSSEIGIDLYAFDKHEIGIDTKTSKVFYIHQVYEDTIEILFNKYVNTGLKLFPKDDYLPLIYLDYIREKGDVAILLKKYEELLFLNPESFDLIFEYAGELFSETHVAESSKRPLNYREQCQKIEDLYNKALSLKPDSYETMLSLGKHFYNQMLFLDEDIYKARGTNPDVVKKKAQLQAQLDELVNKSIPVLEKIFNNYDPMGKLKVSERSNFKSACTLLNYCYDKKKDKAKAEMYQKKYDEADSAHQ